MKDDQRRYVMGLTGKFPRCRETSYKTCRDMERSFYKFVCKNSYFSNLKRRETWCPFRKRYEIFYTRFAGNYRHGYPLFGRHSLVERTWLRQFVQHEEAFNKREADYSNNINRWEGLRDSLDRLVSEAKKEVSNYYENIKGTTGTTFRRTGQIQKTGNNRKRTKRNRQCGRTISVFPKAGVRVRANARTRTQTPSFGSIDSINTAKSGRVQPPLSVNK